jgi:DNA-binding FadR family transcriptional regulator
MEQRPKEDGDMGTMKGQSRRRRRYSPAEAVADRLRERILSGEVPDGGTLPKLEQLTEEFGVSLASVREACRILETEGLLSVIRGNVGGAVAHVPAPGQAAYTLGLVLEARAVAIDDVAAAIERLEPSCAELCAERVDRASTVLPSLRDAQAELATCIDRGDGRGAALAARRWHEALVANCGNETTVVLLGTVAALRTAHVQRNADSLAARGVSLSDELSLAVHAEHEHIQSLIEAGDAAGAAAAARAHLHTARIHPPSEHDDDDNSLVRASAVRDRLYD